VPASEVSRGHDLKRIDIERLIGDDSLQPTVLVLERPHLRNVADFQTAEFRLPGIESRAADAVLAAQIGGLDAGLVLLEHGNDLSFAEPGLLDGASLSEADAAEIRTHPWDTSHVSANERERA
jgi:hypothetical protein